MECVTVCDDKIRVNINASIRFKPTEKMLQIMRADWDSWALYHAIPFDPRLDEEGYKHTQLWDYMRIFGPHIELSVTGMNTELELV